jgi:hypothetical protein
MSVNEQRRLTRELVFLKNVTIRRNGREANRIQVAPDVEQGFGI